MDNRKVNMIRSGESEVIQDTFSSIREGDAFFLNGQQHIAAEDAHYSEDASYDGFLVYDTEGEGFFPNELDADKTASMDRFITLNGQTFSLEEVASALGVPTGNGYIEASLCQSVDGGILTATLNEYDNYEYPFIDVSLHLPAEMNSCPISISRTEKPREGENHAVRTFCYDRNDNYFLYFDQDTRSDMEVDQDYREPSVTLSGDPYSVVHANCENRHVAFSSYKEVVLIKSSLAEQIASAEEKQSSSQPSQDLNRVAPER